MLRSALSAPSRAATESGPQDDPASHRSAHLHGNGHADVATLAQLHPHLRHPARRGPGAYDDNPRHGQLVADSLAKVRELCEELEILTPRTLPMWQGLGVA